MAGKKPTKYPILEESFTNGTTPPESGTFTSQDNTFQTESRKKQVEANIQKLLTQHPMSPEEFTRRSKGLKKMVESAPNPIKRLSMTELRQKMGESTDE